MNELDKRTRISWSGILTGAREIAPIGVFGVPFGLAFGAAAIQAGFEPWSALAMSVTVFAGASQFAALEFWAAPIDLVALLLVVFAVNARHILMGASLYPWMRHIPWARRHLAASLISDVNWAYVMEAHRKGERDLGLLVGSGALMWAGWVLGTAFGVFLGGAIAEPRRYGLDAVMVVFFTCVLVATAKRDIVLLPWIAAAIAAIGATWILPPGWHVLAGGIAGGVVGALGRD